MTTTIAQKCLSNSSVYQQHLINIAIETNTSYTYDSSFIPIKKKLLLKFLDELLEAARTEEFSEEWSQFGEELDQDRLRLGYLEDV